ncbi:ethanolamine utilization protein EutN [Horticoccus luteus]|uniref:Ethanolamine utilization protein EutN n=1 Tax=Horticoccus luteus TaxID=2862869 RepID=A0A8F9XMV0_9BACT|nr:EutN/CcmL family microcompartment protein [Horticoccus luteus]QYM80681.1 ethanolamine utilization protein EutN [Horticoccus luteus]
MIRARIDGVIVTTVAHPSLHGCRTVICQPLDERGDAEGAPVLALDPHGAGQHQHVLVSTDGGATRARVGDEHSPLRNMIIAVLDSAA